MATPLLRKYTNKHTHTHTHTHTLCHHQGGLIQPNHGSLQAQLSERPPGGHGVPQQRQLRLHAQKRQTAACQEGDAREF